MSRSTNVFLAKVATPSRWVASHSSEHLTMLLEVVLQMEILLLLSLVFQLVNFQVRLSVPWCIGWRVWYRCHWEATACVRHLGFSQGLLQREICCLDRWEWYCRCHWHCSLPMSVLLRVLPFLLIMIMWKLFLLFWWCQQRKGCLLVLLQLQKLHLFIFLLLNHWCP